jgi:hypothetical protein
MSFDVVLARFELSASTNRIAKKSRVVTARHPQSRLIRPLGAPPIRTIVSFTCKLAVENAFGQHQLWMRSLNEFASAEGRLIGTIEGNGERFVCGDGRSFPLGDCTCKVLIHDDWFGEL